MLQMYKKDFEKIEIEALNKLIGKTFNSLSDLADDIYLSFTETESIDIWYSSSYIGLVISSDNVETTYTLVLDKNENEDNKVTYTATQLL